MNTVFALIAILGFLIIALPIFFEIKPSKSVFYTGITLLVLSVSLMGSFIKPKIIYDIYRHYQLIDSVRNYNWGIMYAVLRGIPQANANYSYTFLYNLLVALIAKFFPNEMLAFIAGITYYGVFFYVYLKEFAKKKLDGFSLVVSILMCSVMMPYLYIYSGIRNSTAVAIAALGVYRFYKVNHNLIEALILIVAGVLFHPIAAVSLVVLVMSHFKPQLKWLVCIIVIPILLDPIMEWCRLRSGNSFLFWIGAKYYNYTNVREDNQGRVYLYSAIAITLVWCIMLLIRSKTKPNSSNSFYAIIRKMHLEKALTKKNQNMQGREKYDVRFATGIWWYTIFSLAFTKSSNMMIRFPFFLGCLSPFFISYTMGDSLEKRRVSFGTFLTLGCTVALAVLILYENIAWLI